MAHRRLGALYARSFERRPWLTLAIANGTLGALADTIAQSLERMNKKKDKRNDALIGNSNQEWDPARTLRFFTFGVGMAPLLAEWNRWIENRFPLRISSTATGTAGKASLKALAKRVAVDQIAFAPFGLICFVGAMGFMEGRSVQQVGEKFNEMYLPALLANWQVWPLVQTINFRFMPLRYRVPFTGAIGIAWQVFLSILNSSRNKDQSIEENQSVKKLV